MRANETIKNYFQEDQQIRQTWIRAIIWCAMLLPIVLNTIFYFRGLLPQRDFLISMGFVLMACVPVYIILFYTKFQVQVTDEGLRLRWIPFQKKGKLITKSEIKNLYLRKAPIFQYGWRWVPTYGWIYRIEGNSGIQIEKANGKKLFISSGNIMAFKNGMEKLLGRTIENEGLINTDRF